MPPNNGRSFICKYPYIPTIDIIEFDPSTENKFNKHWHTHGDDMNNIDVETLMLKANFNEVFIESKFLKFFYDFFD